MSRKNQDESSLELLLDTMCNTFGGVMFIAISLAVMLSMRGAVASLVEEPAEKIAALQKELTTLQQQFALRQKETKELALRLKKMSSDPRIILVNEVALLEQMLKEKLLEQKLKEQKRTLLQTQLNDILAKKMRIANALKQSQEKNITLVEKIKLLDMQLQKLQKKNAQMIPKNIVFNTLVKKESMPYFMIVEGDSIWPVGPDINKDNYKPASSVTLQIKGSKYFCTPVPGRGVQIFEGNQLSASFTSLLRNIPENRVPEFVISRKDAEIFSKLRDKLKEEKIFHGFRVLKSDQEVFAYQFKNESKGTYEY